MQLACKYKFVIYFFAFDKLYYEKHVKGYCSDTILLNFFWNIGNSNT